MRRPSLTHAVFCANVRLFFSDTETHVTTGNPARRKLDIAVCSEHFRRTTQRVLAQMSRQDVDLIETRVCEDVRAEAEDCLIYSTWRLDNGKNARPIVVRITGKAMYRFRCGEQGERSDMSANFVGNLQTHILQQQYDVEDTSLTAFTIVVDELFLIERR